METLNNNMDNQLNTSQQIQNSSQEQNNEQISDIIQRKIQEGNMTEEKYQDLRKEISQKTKIQQEENEIQKLNKQEIYDKMLELLNREFNETIKDKFEK